MKAMCNRTGQASLASAPIEVLSGLKKNVGDPPPPLHCDIVGGTKIQKSL